MGISSKYATYTKLNNTKVGIQPNSSYFLIVQKYAKTIRRKLFNIRKSSWRTEQLKSYYRVPSPLPALFQGPILYLSYSRVLSSTCPISGSFSHYLSYSRVLFSHLSYSRALSSTCSIPGSYTLYLSYSRAIFSHLS